MATDKGLEDVPEGTFISILLVFWTRIACAIGRMLCAERLLVAAMHPRLKVLRAHFEPRRAR